MTNKTITSRIDTAISVNWLGKKTGFPSSVYHKTIPPQQPAIWQFNLNIASKDNPGGVDKSNNSDSPIFPIFAIGKSNTGKNNTAPKNDIPLHSPFSIKYSIFVPKNPMAATGKIKITDFNKDKQYALLLVSIKADIAAMQPKPRIIVFIYMFLGAATVTRLNCVTVANCS